MIKTNSILIAVIVIMLSGCVTTKYNAGFKTEEKTKSERLETKIKIALQYVNLGEPSRALSVLREEQKKNANDPALNEALGLVFQKTKEYALANQHFQKALKYNPKYTRGRNNYAVFLYEAGSYRESCQQLEIVTRDVYYENRSNAYSNMGLCYLKLGNVARAKQSYVKSLQLQPDNAQSLLELAHLQYQVKDLARAQKNLKTFHMLVPKGVARSLSLGYKLATRLGRSSEASIYKQALKRLYPTSKEARSL
ncbi:MAG: type IV pilus biogenesis/stability protein PilW [Pseudomonadota bacterium]